MGDYVSMTFNVLLGIAYVLFVISLVVKALKVGERTTACLIGIGAFGVYTHVIFQEAEGEWIALLGSLTFLIGFARLLYGYFREASRG